MTKTVITFAKMNPTDLRSVRQQRGWSEQEAARRLGVSQSYLSMLEGGKRRLTSRVARRAMSVFGLPPTVLPPSPPENQWGAETLAQQLAALEYPGFAYMRSHRPKRNPAEVLVGALSNDQLEARVVEALPWLLLRYSNTDWAWLVEQAKVRDLQNRLGFVASLARLMSKRPLRWTKAALGHCLNWRELWTRADLLRRIRSANRLVVRQSENGFWRIAPRRRNIGTS